MSEDLSTYALRMLAYRMAKKKPLSCNGKGPTPTDGARLCVTVRGVAAACRVMVRIVPCGSENNAAEIQAFVVRIFQCQHVRIDGAKGRFRLADHALCKRIDDAFLEVLDPRVRRYHQLALRVGEFVIGQTEHIHFNARSHQCDH